MKRAKHLSHLFDEATKWPGVKLRPLSRRNHAAVEIEFKGKSRKIFLPTTASDHRAAKNSVATFRRILKELGAAKEH